MSFCFLSIKKYCLAYISNENSDKCEVAYLLIVLYCSALKSPYQKSNKLLHVPVVQALALALPHIAHNHQPVPTNCLLVLTQDVINNRLLPKNNNLNSFFCISLLRPCFLELLALVSRRSLVWGGVCLLVWLEFGFRYCFYEFYLIIILLMI